MSDELWAPCARPAPAPDTRAVGLWMPVSVADLTTHRLQLSAAVRGVSAPGSGDAAERLLLAFEELASNALRHGRGPVQVAVTATGDAWVLDVSDAATDRAPVPAVGRDAAQGGLGLYLVARLSDAHGWTVEGDRKHVWARLDRTRATSGQVRPSPPIPQPRAPDTGCRPLP